MNKILNWTLGSVFRTIGRVFGYLLIGGLFALIMSKSGLKITDIFGIDTIKASTISYNYSKWYDSIVNDLGESQVWDSARDLGVIQSVQDFDNNMYLNSIRVRFGRNDKFTANTKYRVKINVIFQNNGNGSRYQVPKSIICQGSSSNNWSSDETLVSCNYVGKTLYNDNNNASYYFDITPTVDVYGIQIAWYYKKPPVMFELYRPSLGDIRVLTSSKITTDSTTSDTINNQTVEIISNQNNNTEQIINNQNEIANVCYTNYLPKSYMFTSGNTYNGLTITKNSDYSITVTGTATENGFINIMSVNNINTFFSEDVNQTYPCVGDYCLYLPNRNTIIAGQTIQNKVLWFISETGKTYNFTWKPMLVKRGYVGEYIQPKETKCFNRQDITNNNLSDTNKSINDLKDQMLDDSIDQDLIDTNYSLQNNSYGPFATFLNLPLIWVNNILASNQSCRAINLPLPYLENKYLTLPCMNGFWNGLGALGDLIQAFWLCIVGVKIFNGLFLLVVDTTSSKDNVDELTKLQTWEL